MKIHKAGYDVILVAFLITALIVSFLIYFSNNIILIYTVGSILLLIFLFIIRFFRDPNREVVFQDNEVISPADGKIVAIEEIEENVFLNEKRIQVSVFMSVWSVHINWYPVVGKVLESNHYSGRFMAAWLPKSSHENERSVVVIDNPIGGKVLVKQIAGAVARRIITYAKKGDEALVGGQLGFIRFGSRVDVLLPVGYEVKVKLDDMVKGGLTLLAEVKK